MTGSPGQEEARVALSQVGVQLLGICELAELEPLLEGSEWPVKIGGVYVHRRWSTLDEATRRRTVETIVGPLPVLHLRCARCRASWLISHDARSRARLLSDGTGDISGSVSRHRPRWACPRGHSQPSASATLLVGRAVDGLLGSIRPHREHPRRGRPRGKGTLSGQQVVDAYRCLWKANGRPPTQKNVLTHLSLREHVSFDRGTLVRALERDFGWSSWHELIERVDLD